MVVERAADAHRAGNALELLAELGRHVEQLRGDEPVHQAEELPLQVHPRMIARRET